MTVSSLVTSGYICDPTTVPAKTVIVQQTIQGTVEQDDQLTGSLVADDRLSGSVVEEDSLTGSIAEGDQLQGTISNAGLLVGVIRCDGEVIMADINLTRGDSRTIEIEILDSLGVAVDITEGIVRFAVKERAGQTNAEALVNKYSYFIDEIEKNDPTGGKALIYLRVDDTINLQPGSYCWDADLTRKGTLATSTGTFAATNGSEVLQYTGSGFDNFRLGQVVELTSVNVANQGPRTITALDADSETVTIGGYSQWVTESGMNHNTYTGDRKTPSGLSGRFVIQADVVR